MVKSGKYEVKQPNIFGRIGTGIGKGLAESLPKEIERGRLSAGLKQFEQDAPNLSPLQQATRLFSIPGVTPQMVQVLPDLLRQQNERQSAIDAANQATSQETSPPSIGNVAPAQPRFQPNQKVSEDGISPNKRGENLIESVGNLANRNKGISTTGPINAALGDIRPPTQRELFNKRAEILKAKPFMSVQAAQAEAEDYFNRLNAQKAAEIEKGSRQEKVENKIETDFNKELKLLLQKEGQDIFKNITGERISELRGKAEEDVANGLLTPTQAIRKYARLGLEEAKDKSNFNKMAQTPLILQKPSVVDRNLRAGARTAKDLGRSAQYSSDIQSEFKNSKEYADSIAYPIEDNKFLNSYVEKQKPQIGRGLALLPDTEKSKQLAIKNANDVYKNFSEGDSINSFIVAMKSKDPFFDDVAFRDRMLELYEQGKFRANPDQRRELENQESSWFPNLYDWWMKLSR